MEENGDVGKEVEGEGALPPPPPSKRVKVVVDEDDEEEEEDDSDEEESARNNSTAFPRPIKAVRHCPYLGTIDRHVLDFDFEKLCCISLANQHVYCCLVCGKYFQGRGRTTHAYTHALEESHYVFINLHDCRIYCLPDNYEVQDASLDDIKYYLNPTFSGEDVKRIASRVTFGKALDGGDFLPGCIGLNNLKATDYFNVIIQIMCNVIPLRNTMLLLDLTKKQRTDPVLTTLSELLRKIFNTRNFKGIVSPHEFLQAVGVQSGKKFRIGQQQDPLLLFSWLLNRLHKSLGAVDRAKERREGGVLHFCFRGAVVVKTFSVAPNARVSTHPIKEQIAPFLYLTLNVPNAPIFKDSLERNMIPQVPIFDLLQKFDGEMEIESGPGKVNKYSLWRLPPYLVIHVKRFSKNNFFVEKNPTIVTFPVKNFDLREYLHPDALDANPVTRYDLVANVCHIGKPNDGFYKIHVLHAATNEWYELEDLRVSQVLPQLVALSESYIQVYQRQDVMTDGALDQKMSAEAAASAGTNTESTDQDLDMFA